MFIDLAKISLKAGQGGSGCVSFRREKFVPKGGPDGGDGGRGGSIFLRAERNLHTLIDFKYKRLYKAKRGQHGMGSNKNGKKAADLYIKVPVGTVVKNARTGKAICDLVSHGQEIMAAQGGNGGRGNARFVTASNRAPREWEVGRAGEECDLELELKLIADIGLVGLPNAGKSTLLSRISEARPKIAGYPFTTLKPNLGIVRFKEFHSFVVADIPGLIQGSHQGKGLGHQFLRHIERTRALAFLIEVTDPEPQKTLQLLKNELYSYSKVLVDKPSIILITKIDVEKFKQKKDLAEEGNEIIPLSAVSGENIHQVITAFYIMLQKLNSKNTT